MSFQPKAEEIAALHNSVNLRTDQAAAAFEKATAMDSTPSVVAPVYDRADLERHQERVRKLAELQARYPGITIDKLPLEMTPDQLENFTRVTGEYNVAQQRAAVPPLPAPQKHPRDMTDAEFKAYQAAWVRQQRARRGD